ncbi:MAG: amidohydrolase [Anaerolineae bacterium]|nr:amidohydrolase [Anaerolineae bacterium]
MLSNANAILPRLVEIRRRLHQYPELGFQEHQTAEYIAGLLASLGLKPRTGVGKTGVVADMGAGRPIVALRADMDALPIQEENDVPYASRNPGVMHACGHDVHMACLVGAAILLREHSLPGTVRLIFQPSEEEQDAEGQSGAMRMVAEGVMDGVSAVFGMHVDDEAYAGTAGVRPGPVMAAADAFRIVVRGQGSHGAYPHKGVDPILLAAQVVVSLNHVVARRISPLDSGVISIGSIHGGTKSNIIPAEVEIKGTVRSFTPEVRGALFDGVRRACEVARALGGDYDVAIQEGYPPTVNDPELTRLAQRVGHELLGERFGDQPVEMGAEDFSIFAAKAPGCYLRLGVRASGQPLRAIHTSRFDVDESALAVGAALFAALALARLEQGD